MTSKKKVLLMHS